MERSRIPARSLTRVHQIWMSCVGDPKSRNNTRPSRLRVTAEVPHETYEIAAMGRTGVLCQILAANATEDRRRQLSRIRTDAPELSSAPHGKPARVVALDEQHLADDLAIDDEL